MSKLSLNALLSSVGIVPAAAAAAPGASEDGTVVGTIATTEQLESLAAAAHAEGSKAANQRYAAVLGSDAGKANHGYAMHLLADADLAGLSADKLIAMVAAAGPAKAADTKTDDGKGKPGGVDAGKIEAETPKIELKTGQAAGETGKADEKGDKGKVASVQDDVVERFNAKGAAPTSFTSPFASKQSFNRAAG